MKREREVYGDSCQTFCQELEKAGVMYLSDESAEFGDDIRITGCNMQERYYRHRFTVPGWRKGSWRAMWEGENWDGIRFSSSTPPCFLKSAAAGERI